MIARLRLLLLVLHIGGCQVHNPNISLDTIRAPLEDPTTHEIFMPLDQVMTFSRSEPRLSPFGQDFVHLMPLQISRNGYRVTYLWLGISSTIDRGASPVGRRSKTRVLHEFIPVGLRIRMTPAHATPAQEVTLPLVEWSGGQLLGKYVAIPVTDSLRSAIDQVDFRRLMKENPQTLALVDQVGRERSFSHAAGVWKPY